MLRFFRGKRWTCPLQDLRNAPVAKKNPIPDRTAAKRPPAALRRLEIKLRPAGEVGRNSEHRALDYSESQHFAFLFSYQLQRRGPRTQKRVSDLEYFESLFLLVWCLRKCVLASACPSKSWSGVREPQHPPACNNALITNTSDSVNSCISMCSKSDRH